MTEPVGSLLLPPWQRARLRPVLAFAAALRTAVEQGHCDGAVDAIEYDLDRIAAGGRAGEWHRLRRIVRRRGLPVVPFRHLVEAARQDCALRRYATASALLGYCELSAAPLATLTVHALGPRPPEPVLARLREGYTAARLLLLCSRVPADAARARVYLPAEYLDGDDLESAAPEAVHRLAVQARTLLVGAAPALHSLSYSQRIAAAGILADAHLLERALRRARYDVFGAELRSTLPRRQAALLRVGFVGRALPLR